MATERIAGKHQRKSLLYWEDVASWVLVTKNDSYLNKPICQSIFNLQRDVETKEFFGAKIGLGFCNVP